MQTQKSQTRSKKSSYGRHLASKAGLKNMASEGKDDVKEVKTLISRWKTLLPIAVAVAAGAFFIRGRSAKQSVKEGLSKAKKAS